MSPEMETPEKYEPIPVGRYADALGMIDKLRRERDDLKAKLTQVEADAAAMREALRGVVNSAVHPDKAWRSVLVELAPVRKALATGSGQRLLDEIATLRDTAKRRLKLLRSLNDANRLHIYPAIFCCECGAAFHGGHKPNCPLAAELKEGK